jgi:hypothetical protein
MPGKWNPFNREEQHVEDPEVKPNGEVKTQEKSPAEMIAESITSALQPVVTQLGEFRTKLDAVEAATKKPEKQEPAPGENVTPSVFDSEDAAFNTRLGPIVAQQLAMEARITYGEVKQEYVAKGYGEMLAQWDGEIQKVLDGSPLVTGDGKRCRGDKVYIRNVINMVFGEKALASGVKFGGRDRGFFTESAGGSNDSPQAMAQRTMV